jgi:hypothetical protein
MRSSDGKMLYSTKFSTVVALVVRAWIFAPENDSSNGECPSIARAARNITPFVFQDQLDRGRIGVGRAKGIALAPPPSEPDGRISRIRLSGWWFYLIED